MAGGRPTVVVDDATARRLEALVRAGKSAREIHATMTREGLAPPSRATIGRMAKGRSGRPRAVAARAPKAAVGSKPAAAPASGGGDALDRWTALAEQLQEQATRALKDDDTATFNAISRTLNQALSQLAKATPAVAPSIEESPDMIDAAARGRAKLADYLERARLGKS